MHSRKRVSTKASVWPCLLATLGSCAAASGPSNQAKVFRDVRDTFAAFASAYSGRNLDALMSCYSESMKPVVFGLGHVDRCIGRDEIRTHVAKDWEGSRAANLLLGWNDVVLHGNYASMLGECAFVSNVDGGERRAQGRISITFLREGGAWRILHLHASIPSGS